MTSASEYFVVYQSGLCNRVRLPFLWKRRLPFLWKIVEKKKKIVQIPGNIKNNGTIVEKKPGSIVEKKHIHVGLFETDRYKRTG